MNPDIIFLIPYRNREEHKMIFQEKMEQIIQKYDKKCEIYYCFQNDERTFNRGALKNIGFLAMKEKYPEHYQNITFVFNDIDTFPTESHYLDYATEINTVKHFFGFTFALNQRVKKHNIQIDRTNFVSVNDKSGEKIVQLLHDNNKRQVNSKEFSYYRHNISDDVTDIHNLNYDIIDNMITIHNFETKYNEDIQYSKEHDLEKKISPFNSKIKMHFT